jgi:hypothetical protein
VCLIEKKSEPDIVFCVGGYSLRVKELCISRKEKKVQLESMEGGCGLSMWSVLARYLYKEDDERDMEDFHLWLGITSNLY